MDFTDDQSSFTAIFGQKSQIYGYYPARPDQEDIKAASRDYANKCMFNVFLHICREDYVDNDGGTSTTKMVHDICKKTVKSLMEYKCRPGNRLCTDNPDELYTKLISMAAALHEDATGWPLSLCDTYFSALVEPLKDKMDDDNFHMPSLHGLTTKTLQIGSLRTVQSTAVVSFISMADEEKRLRRLLSNTNNCRGSHNLLN